MFTFEAEHRSIKVTISCYRFTDQLGSVPVSTSLIQERAPAKSTVVCDQIMHKFDLLAFLTVGNWLFLPGTYEGSLGETGK